MCLFTYARFKVFAIAFALAVAAVRPTLAETRIALVIGNGAYQNVPRLPNPPNDARDVAAALKRSGFETILATDLDKSGMEDATIRFARVSRNADVALFYYSGHAIQFNGVNYLAPVDIKLTDEADLRRMTRVDDVVSDLQQAKNLRILVLDSCRDNPLAEQLRRSIGATRAIPLQRAGKDRSASGHDRRLCHSSWADRRRRRRPQQSLHGSIPQEHRRPGGDWDDLPAHQF
jgi:hypothetical protein